MLKKCLISLTLIEGKVLKISKNAWRHLRKTRETDIKHTKAIFFNCLKKSSRIIVVVVVTVHGDRVASKTYLYSSNSSFFHSETKSQFHHHFMSSFYERRSQLCKKDKQVFALLGSAHVKAVHKLVDEIDPKSHFMSSFCADRVTLILLADGIERRE